MNTCIKLYITILAVSILGACKDNDKAIAPAHTATPSSSGVSAPARPVSLIGSDRVFVHLFEWSWPDIAKECEDFLGPNGYAAVQISPPQEHIQGPQWWTRYQPVSYKVESRSGSRAEFADMVERCRAVGVGIYADAVINHMADITAPTGLDAGTGIADSEYSKYVFPVPYDYDDFHHCGRNGDGRIGNYQDLWEVQTCSLGALPDLDTAKPEVQRKIAAYLNDLVDLGVAGMRLDAVKHISHEEVGEITSLLDSNVFIFQEVIDRGDEPINAMDYLGSGSVTEFKYQIAINDAFVNGRLGSLAELGSGAGYLPADQAVVFTDNHDSQRGHGGGEGVMSYKLEGVYDLANVFMLAWPYGYPKVMSSYRFEDHQQGPPASKPVEDGICTADWVCEHRRPSIAGMIGFRKATSDAPVTNWQAFGDELISFGRGDRGHVVINVSDETVDATFITMMRPGEYCNVVSGGTPENKCNGSIVQVGDDGIMQVSLVPMSAVAIHLQALL